MCRNEGGNQAMTTTMKIDWLEFFDRLENHVGPGCTGKTDRPISRKILASMGASVDQIEECLALFEEHGGYCDCEVVMNAQERICPESIPTAH
jgi:Protein of unknown function (DUF2695)